MQIKEHESELERTVDYLIRLARESKDFFLLLVLFTFVYSLFVLAPQIMRIVLLSYGISMLLRPVVIIIRVSTFRFLRIPAGVIAILFSLFVLSTVFGLCIWIFPPLVASLADTLTTVSYEMPTWFIDKVEKLGKVFGFSLPKRQEVLTSLISYGRTYLTKDAILSVLSGFLETVFAGYSFGMTLLNLFLAPIFIFYMSQNWTALNRGLVNLVPSTYRSSIVSTADTIEDTIVKYSKAQFSVALVLVFLYSLALLIIRLPNAVPIGILSGLLSVIPYAGLSVGLITSILVSLSSGPDGVGVLAPVFAFLVVQLIEGNVVTPKIMSESTGLHAGVVLLSLLIGGSAFGLIGVVFAVPAVATFRNILLSRAR